MLQDPQQPAQVGSHAVLWWLRRAREKLQPTFLSPEQLPEFLRKRLRHQEKPFFVQIGSNDGSTGDPLRALVLENRKWRGIFVEPVTYLFARLVENYARDPRFQFENVAVAETRQKRQFYYIKPSARAVLPELPYWYDQVGSFDRGHIVKHFGAQIEEHIVECEVNCVRFDDLCGRNGVRKIDLLHIDAEGYDYRIMKQVDLSRFKPKIIMLEHEHIKHDEKAEVCQLFARNGYWILLSAGDLVAVRERWMPKVFMRHQAEKIRRLLS